MSHIFECSSESHLATLNVTSKMNLNVAGLPISLSVLRGQESGRQAVIKTRWPGLLVRLKQNSWPVANAEYISLQKDFPKREHLC